MKLFRLLTSLAACLVILSAVSVAQPPSPCNPCVTYCSFTQGGWGAPCNGGNVGCLRNECFDDIYPNGVTIGNIAGYPDPNECCWLHLSTSQDVQDFLPQGTTPEALTQNYTNPGTGNITVFAGQVLALQLNVDYGAYGCGSMVDISGLEIAGGDFEGWTIQELLDAANIALGGGSLPPGVDIGDLSDACGAVNENFDDCTNNNGYIVIPPQGETVIAREPGVELPLSFCLNFTEQCSDICVMWWCPFCQPGDLAVFTWEPGACDQPDVPGNCPLDCSPGSGLSWGEQVKILDNPDGTCWWYTVFHADEPGCFCVSFDVQLAANLISFTAAPGNSQVSLAWATASERENARFDIERSTNNATWTAIGSVPGQGTTVTTTPYSYVDNSVTNGVEYQYRLISVDVNGNHMPVGDIESATPSVRAGAPREFALHQNYPNPFNPSTQIRFDIAEASHVTLTVFDVNGREVATLVNGDLAAHSYEVTFDASGLSSGTYFYRLNAGSFSSMNKMLILK